MDTVDPGAVPLVELAKSDLSRRTGIPLDEIKAVNMTPVDWPDASLGHPEKGKVYAQVITPGYRIILQARGEEYEYHSDLEERVVFVDK